MAEGAPANQGGNDANGTVLRRAAACMGLVALAGNGEADRLGLVRDIARHVSALGKHVARIDERLESVAKNLTRNSDRAGAAMDDRIAGV
jgi:hypothetical protein